MNKTDLDKLIDFANKNNLQDQEFSYVLEQFYEYMEECEALYLELQSNMYY